ncbi:MAG TPA: hypothetical protein VGR57_10905 [Ktedonobacterales bacterium]|nr:hypothetical protein [Ktedonobacterales bacterium]
MRTTTEERHNVIERQTVAGGLCATQVAGATVAGDDRCAVNALDNWRILRAGAVVRAILVFPLAILARPCQRLRYACGRVRTILDSTLYAQALLAVGHQFSRVMRHGVEVSAWLYFTTAVAAFLRCQRARWLALVRVLDMPCTHHLRSAITAPRLVVPTILAAWVALPVELVKRLADAAFGACLHALIFSPARLNTEVGWY